MELKLEEKVLTISVETEEGVEIHDIDEEALSALLPTDIEYFIDTPISLNYRTKKEMLEMEIPGEIMVGHAHDFESAKESVIGYRKEAIATLQKEIEFFTNLKEEV